MWVALAFPLASGALWQGWPLIYCSILFNVCVNQEKISLKWYAKRHNNQLYVGFFQQKECTHSNHQEPTGAGNIKTSAFEKGRIPVLCGAKLTVLWTFVCPSAGCSTNCTATEKNMCVLFRYIMCQYIRIYVKTNDSNPQPIMRRVDWKHRFSHIFLCIDTWWSKS